MTYALEIILAVTSLLLIVLILLHRGKGGGLSDMFGGGFSSSFAGSSVVEKNLDRFTLITASSGSPRSSVSCCCSRATTNLPVRVTTRQ